MSRRCLYSRRILRIIQLSSSPEGLSGGLPVRGFIFLFASFLAVSICQIEGVANVVIFQLQQQSDAGQAAQEMAEQMAERLSRQLPEQLSNLKSEQSSRQSTQQQAAQSGQQPTSQSKQQPNGQQPNGQQPNGQQPNG